MTKIVIIIPCWKRSKILELIVRQFDVVYKHHKENFDITFFYVFSEDDPELDALMQIYDGAKHKRCHIFSDNKKLGQKINDAVNMAETMGYDYVMNMGSDDLIHPDLFNLYKPYIDACFPFFGIGSLYFIEKGKPAYYFYYYNTPHVIGAGRMIHRSVIDEVKKRFGNLYDADICRGMDSHSARRIFSVGFPSKTVYRKDFPYVVDVKSEVNINGFESVIKDTNKDRFKQSSMAMLKLKFDVLNNF